uniref:Uncharacterized protein n=1 Tax=Rhizophora mucronata TaxID=61149 RepID=A0A2P2PKS0_RHIMU
MISCNFLAIRSIGCLLTPSTCHGSVHLPEQRQ